MELIPPPDITPERIAARIGDLLRSMEEHRKAIDPAGDPEELHDFRVCLRRVRTLCAHIEPTTASASVAGELKWLGKVTGEARDFDVLADDLRRALREKCANFRAVHPRIERLIEDRRLVAHRNLGSALASRRYARLLRSARGKARNATPRQRSPVGAGAVARAQIGAADLYRKALRQGRGLTENAPDEKFHRLRKTIKKLRYLLETRPESDRGSRADSGIRSLKAIQTVLGELNDASVQRELLEGLKGGLAAGTEGSRKAQSCIDELLALGEKRRRRLKTAFTQNFEELRASTTRLNLIGPDPEASNPP